MDRRRAPSRRLPHARLRAAVFALLLALSSIPAPASALELICWTPVREPPPTAAIVEALHLRFDAARGELSTLLRVRDPDGTDAHHTEASPCPGLAGRAPVVDARRRNTLLPADPVPRPLLAVRPERCFDPLGAEYLLSPDPETDGARYARDRPQSEAVLVARRESAPPPAAPCALYAAHGPGPQPFADPGRLQAFRLGGTSLLALVLLDRPAQIAVIDAGPGGTDCVRVGDADAPHRLFIRRDAALALRAATGRLGLFALDAALDAICR